MLVPSGSGRFPVVGIPCDRRKPRDQIVHFAGEPRRLFHEVLLQEHTDGLRAKGYHLCGHDTYATDYVFDAAMHTFQIIHQVTGPHKNYKSATTYARCA